MYIMLLSLLLASFIGELPCPSSKEVFSAANTQKIEEYNQKREAALLASSAISFDQGLSLSMAEKQVDTYLKSLKDELFAQYQKEGRFPPAHNFILERACIEKNKLYDFIKKMPKGGLLHIHSASFVTADWMVKELATLPNCYIYWKEEGPIMKGTMHFYDNNAVPEGFELLKDVKMRTPHFDALLLSLIQIEKEDLNDSNLWQKFEACFTRTSGLIHYKPAFIKYYTYALETLIEDNIQYMEMRALNSTVYDLNGSVSDANTVMEIFLEIKKQIQKTHPNFNFNIIYTDFRNDSNTNDLCKMERAYYLRSLYPEFVIGYDLVGEEDAGRTTLSYLEPLIASKAFEKKYGVTMPYYFHDGESSWAHNRNLFDAVLLKCKRIGHAFNLFYFPSLIETIKKENICIEICPISNQVLGYTHDLRTHPAAGYLRAGVPCVLSSDDPGLFGYTGMSADIWEAVMAWDLDLQALKQLFINSLQYSGMNEKDKKRALDTWNNEWNEFISATSNQESA